MKIFRRLFTNAKFLQYKSSFRFITWFCADVLRFSRVVIAQIVEAQAVFFRVNQRGQFVPQGAELGFIEDAFKHGVLHALAMAHAAFCHFS